MAVFDPGIASLRNLGMECRTLEFLGFWAGPGPMRLQAIRPYPHPVPHVPRKNPKAILFGSHRIN